MAVGWPLDSAECVHFALERTHEVVVETRTDPSGLDVLWKEVTIQVATVWNPAATATGKPGGYDPFNPGGLGVRGDFWAVSFDRLREILTTPRQRVTVTAGPKEVFGAPIVASATGKPLPCDPAGGPFIDRISIVPFGELRTAFVSFRVRLAFQDQDNWLLSNRWRAESTIDGHTTLTRRVIRGRAVFRLDYLASVTPQALADQFRAVVGVTQPSNMARVSVNVVATERGDALDYVVVDQEQALNLNSGRMALSIEWNASSGAEADVKDTRTAAVRRVGVPLGAAAAAAYYGFGGVPAFAVGYLTYLLTSGGGAVGETLVYGIPTAKAQATCRVKGFPGADIDEMVALGLWTCTDRFLRPELIGKIRMVSAYVTQGGASGPDAEPPWVEVRTEMVLLTLNAFALVVKPKGATKLMNYDKTRVGPLSSDPKFGNPPLPSSGEMRGTYIALLVSQVLGSPSEVPAAYPDDTSPDYYPPTEYPAAV